jgi:putative transposase
MTKLNERKIGWIMRELGKEEMSVGQIAKVQKISPRRVRQLREHLAATGKAFSLKTERIVCRRTITDEERRIVAEAHKKYCLGSTMLERLIERDFGRHIPHNVIQQILAGMGKTKPLGKKVKRKGWVRFERKHSNSMWHTDYTLLKGGKWFICYEDDASRKIVSHGEFDEATTEHAIEVLKKGIATHGKPRQMLTGRDVQFYTSEAEGRTQGKTDFQLFLEKEGIKHILGRVNHPQTNGKEERAFGTVKAKLEHFDGSVDATVHWYNETKPHMSLDYENLETPAQAFIRKMHHLSNCLTTSDVSL